MKEFEIIDDYHKFLNARAMAFGELSDFANKIAKEHRIVGMTLLAQMVEGEAQLAKLKAGLRNVALACGHGFDEDSEMLTMDFHHGRYMLVAKPLQGASEAPED